jgi:hypothetical protein
MGYAAIFDHCSANFLYKYDCFRTAPFPQFFARPFCPAGLYLILAKQTGCVAPGCKFNVESTDVLLIE